MEGLIYRNLYDEDGAIVSNDGKILYKVPDITHYRIKEGVEEIDKHAFKNCPHLKEVDIPVPRFTFKVPEKIEKPNPPRTDLKEPVAPAIENEIRKGSRIQFRIQACSGEETGSRKGTL